MSVPASILELLDSRKVAYNVTQLDAKGRNLSLVSNANATIVVKSLLVQDGNGRAQVLLPADHMLDLDAMFRQFGRKFEGVDMKSLRSYIAQSNLSNMPAIPSWQDMPTFIDSSLLKAESLLLECGTQADLLEINQAAFEPMIANATAGSFALKAPQLVSDASKDEAQIITSIQRFTERRIRQRLDETLELPPLPETAQRIIKLRADPNADISDLTNIVEIDPSLAAQVVSWAASPYYSAPGKIKSVHDAIVRVLGFDMVLNLALGLALGKTLSMKAISQQQLNDYWREAVYTAAAVEGLVTSISREHRPSFGMAYLSGLLNNFGFMVMSEIFPPYLESINRLCKGNPHLPRAAIEQHVIGVSGDQIASWLLDNWSMPEEVVIALRQKFNTAYSDDHNCYAKLVYVAKYMLANHGFGESLGRDIPDSLFEELHLERETANVTIENILEAGEDLDAIAEKMRG